MLVSTITWTGRSLKIIDQNQLPHTLTYVHCRNLPDVIEAIKTMKVRGAPAIGIAAAYGVYLGIKNTSCDNFLTFKKELDRVCHKLACSRPTAVNLFNALAQVKKKVEENRNRKISILKALVLKNATTLLKDDRKRCRAIGRYGARVVSQHDTVLTYCNAGALATADYGTALGVIYSAKGQGKKVKVYACETRPKLQGARLTCWELLKNKIDVTLICDNMVASIMKKKLVKKVIVGADRIALNGDTANKIGTYMVALLAHVHKIPFYVAAPLSTIDRHLKNGKRIPIEQRSRDEVIRGFGAMTAPAEVNVYNPAFDVTPSKYITAIITEKGIIKPPYILHLKRLLHI